MNGRDLDWRLWRSFAAVLDTGSLSAAARKLGLSQPTLGRHIEALERYFGLKLFERGLRGLVPTPTALGLSEPVDSALRNLAQAALIAEGAQADLRGTVRLTASVVTAHYILPKLLAALRRDYPAIALEIVASDSPDNLLLREADIAIRMFRPTQLDLITRRVGAVPLIACAHEDYLARRGTPREILELYQHDLIGLDRSDLILLAARANGFELERSDFALRSDSQSLLWELMRAGLGIGFAQKPMVDGAPDVVAILPQIDIAPLEYWLTTHREVSSNGRIRAVYDRLGELLVDFIAASV